MGCPYPGDGSDDLRDDIAGGNRPRQFTPQPECDAHGRIEMRAGNRPEYQDEDNEDRAGWYRVAQKRKRDVPVRELLGHDARADHGCQQEGRAQPFREDAPCQ